ncbi:MAG: CaiB/BaiF CoA-transferase family protein [Gammaproteobacteria bacterium]|nr:CaiB/BaiF CoA-transferase family protein [Gammaproteobacteria bacterium]MCY4217870.1 CaiB/BaiF CoA-transferase family protein [Gammaproteobacteria bacterium]
MKDALKGILVVTIEQAVAAPVCTRRLAEAGARVIKIEREGGDFARQYDCVAGGDSSYFLWTNLGKESVIVDFKNPEGAELLNRILSRADIFVQNLGPGALQRAGFGSYDLRKKFPKLITCDITGYGTDTDYGKIKAYDLLIQAEGGLISINGGETEMGRVGVSICDINAGMNAYAGILEALLSRANNGLGSGIEISLFSTIAELMTVPLLHNDYGAGPPKRTGISHPSIAPYGAYFTSDKKLVIIAIQNEREWGRFCKKVLGQPKLTDHNNFSTNDNRVENRDQLDKLINQVTVVSSRDDLSRLLKNADIAHGFVNTVDELSCHPALKRRIGISSLNQTIHLPEKPVCKLDVEEERETIPRVPTLGEHTEKIKAEFSE